MIRPAGHRLTDGRARRTDIFVADMIYGPADLPSRCSRGISSFRVT